MTFDRLVVLSLMYNLLWSNESMQKVKRELRTTFKSFEEIDAAVRQVAVLKRLHQRVLAAFASTCRQVYEPACSWAMIDGIWVPFGTRVVYMLIHILCNARRCLLSILKNSAQNASCSTKKLVNVSMIVMWPINLSRTVREFVLDAKWHFSHCI